MSGFPVLLHTTIDAADCRALGESYRQLLGLRYREGEEPPPDGSPDDADFKVPTVEDLERHRERAEMLGARLLHDRSKDEGEPL